MEYGQGERRADGSVAHDRRKGPRRVEPGGTVDFDRRRSDRRRRRPGLAALFGAIFGASGRTEHEASMSSAELN
jgi:hypothetical protein